MNGPETIGPPLRVVVSTHTSPGYVPPARFSADQIVLGPNYPNARRNDGGLSSLTLPPGAWDVPATMAQAGIERIDLFVAFVDAFFGCVPRNLAALDCPKLLLVGDTHHGDHPLRAMLSYALAEPYDMRLLVHDPHHVHWFAEAGLAAEGLPGLNVLHFPQARPRDPEGLVFVGATGERHPHRQRLLEGLAAAGRTVTIARDTPEGAARRYAAASASLNVSLNGDLNMRVFEVPGAGGLLVTERLAPQAALDHWFREGEHCLAFADLDELVRTLDRLEGDPKMGAEIARAGHRRYLDRFTPDRFADHAIARATGKAGDADLLMPRDRRLDAVTARSAADLIGRLAVYEFLQERHRLDPAIDVAFLAGTDARLACDAVDLPRLRAHWLGEAAVGALFVRAGVAGQVAMSQPQAAVTRRWDVVVAPPEIDPGLLPPARWHVVVGDPAGMPPAFVERGAA
jgi:hypothetical protein